MKFSIVSGLDESSSSEGEILKRYSQLCEFLSPLGFKGIELAILKPEIIPVKEIKNISDSYEMMIPALGTGSTFLRFRYSFGDMDSKIRDKAIERIKKYIEFSTISNSKVIIGLIRGRFSHKNNPDNEKKNIILSLKKCCKLAEDNNVELIFEPINRFEIDSYNTIRETLEMIEEIGSEKLKLMVDSFHTHLEEDPTTIWDYLDSIAKKVSHLHLADDTRRAPGTGHFDFKRFLNIFEKKSFMGFASVETIMKPSFEDVANQTMNYMKSINIL
jgi:sugar phosphate isomerase/epimerase